MKKIYYTSPFIPPEIIHSKNLIPCRIIPGIKRTFNLNIKMGICSFAEAFIETLTEKKDASGFVFAASCDQMRRVYELFISKANQPSFLFNVPSLKNNPNSRKMYIDELKRLEKFLINSVGLGLNSKKLFSSIKLYEQAYARILKFKPVLSDALFKDSEMDINYAAAGIKNFAYKTDINIAILGDSLPPAYFDIFGFLRKKNSSVVLDGTDSGERCIPGVMYKEIKSDNPYKILMHKYFLGIPNIYQKPDTDFYSWLKTMIIQRGINGIIILRNIWCDLWRGITSDIKHKSKIHVLAIDLNDDYQFDQHSKNKIDAFIEMLKDEQA